MTNPLIPFPPGCKIARLITREKRFTIIAELDGSLVRAHTNNTGTMLGLLRKGRKLLLSPALNPSRKLAWTAEALALDDSENPAWVGINTQMPNRVLHRAFVCGMLPWAAGYRSLRLEAACGESRLDGLLNGPGLPNLWVECKNVTLVEDETAVFPDAVTARGSKHLGTMRAMVAEGCRAAMLYLVQRPDARCFAPADYIDSGYAEQLKQAIKAGVEVYPLNALIGTTGLHIGGPLPLARSYDWNMT